MNKLQMKTPNTNENPKYNDHGLHIIGKLYYFDILVLLYIALVLRASRGPQIVTGFRP